METIVVAVDGPSGSGKSSTARGVAEALGWAYLDTGAMYRAMTWAMLQRRVDVDDAEEVAATASRVDVRVGTDPSSPQVHADGTDVAEPIRGPEVTAAVSAVSAVAQVRAAMVDSQRTTIASAVEGIVVEGRDIASVVAPDAAVKVYLVADADARAQRRTAEQGGADGDVAATGEDLARRDALDSGRSASPLRQDDGATVVDTTHLSLAEVVEQIVAMVQAVREEQR